MNNDVVHNVNSVNIIRNGSKLSGINFFINQKYFLHNKMHVEHEAFLI